MDNLTVVIPFYEGHGKVERLLETLQQHHLPVIVVDDQSTVPFVSTLPNVLALRPNQKKYFTGAVNYGAQHCATDVLVLNQDVELEGDQWLTLLAEHRQQYALIGERIKGEHPAFPHGYVHGTFQFMRRDAITAAGYMDEAHYPIWGASALWQWQITRKGFKSHPVAHVPGLRHDRPANEAYGSSIKKLLELEPERKGLFIRTPPALSVVIPCYNHGRFLPEAIASLIGGRTELGEHPGQTFQSFEVIIVDDGSTDETHEVGRALANSWQGIRYIRQANAGSGAAMNAGIKAAVGRFIVRMDADDLREAWSLEDLFEAAEEHPHSLIYDEPTLVSAGKRQNTMRLRAYDFDTLIYKNHVHAGICFPRQGWVEAGGYPTAGAIRHGREDWAFNVALGLKGYCGVKIGRGGYLYRRHGANRTEFNTSQEWQTTFAKQMVALFPELYRGVRPNMCCGKGAKPMSSNRNAAPAPSAIAQADISGMVKIEYVGRNVGSSRWGGAGSNPTGREYVFGANNRDRVKFIDQRDLAWFLDQRNRGEALFKVAAKAEEPEPLTDNDPVALYLQSGGLTLPDLASAGGFADEAEAVTSLRAFLNAISRPTETAAGKLKELGIKRTQAARSFAEAQQQLQDALLGLPEAERQSVAFTLFGAAGYRAAMAVLSIPPAEDRDGDNNNVADNLERQPEPEAPAQPEEAPADLIVKPEEQATAQPVVIDGQGVAVVTEEPATDVQKIAPRRPGRPARSRSDA